MTKTETVFSNNSIFNVNNINIDSKIYKNRENFLEIAFKKAFNRLINRILLDEDYKKLSSISIPEIKNLISHYQIIEPKVLGEDFNVNVFFHRDKINNFFNINNISYSDVLNSQAIVFPILQKNKETFIYANNYFYNSWNKLNTNYIEYINFILPIESIESLNLFKVKKEYLEKIEINNLFKEYETKNKFFIIINDKEEKLKILLKSNISGKKITKNIEYPFDPTDNKFYDSIILKLKKEIFEIIKSQNSIDVSTPSFLNISINLNNQNDLKNLLDIFKKIDLIENYTVLKLNKSYAVLRLKYYGNINKISEKFSESGLKVKIDNNQWILFLI